MSARKYTIDEVIIEKLTSTRIMDISGMYFGKLHVVGYAGIDKYGKALWWCQCSCNNDYYYKFVGTELRSGNSKSCGCNIAEFNKRTKTKKKYIAESYNVELGTYKRIYDIYYGMKDRCNNVLSKDYYKYGYRGIKLCDEWNNDRELFIKWSIEHGYDNNLSIDRIDVNKGYSPDNCRWVTIDVQQLNKRGTIYIDYKGETRTACSVFDELHIPREKRAMYYTRLDRYGWSIEKTLTTINKKEMFQNAYNALENEMMQKKDIVKKDFCIKYKINLMTFLDYIGRQHKFDDLLFKYHFVDNKHGKLVFIEENKVV